MVWQDIQFAALNYNMIYDAKNVLHDDMNLVLNFDSHIMVDEAEKLFFGNLRKRNEEK